MKNRSKKISPRRPRRVDKRTRQVRNGSVFRVQAACGSGQRMEPLYPDQLAAVALHGERAARRWISAKKLPRLVQALLEHRVLGLIHDKAFDGWHVRDGHLVTPKGAKITPELILGLAHVHHRSRWQTLTIKQLEAKINRLEEAIDLWRERAGELPVANDSKMD